MTKLENFINTLDLFLNDMENKIQEERKKIKEKYNGLVYLQINKTAIFKKTVEDFLKNKNIEIITNLKEIINNEELIKKLEESYCHLLKKDCQNCLIMGKIQNRKIIASFKKNGKNYLIIGYYASIKIYKESLEELIEIYKMTKKENMKTYILIDGMGRKGYIPLLKKIYKELDGNIINTYMLVNENVLNL